VVARSGSPTEKPTEVDKAQQTPTIGSQWAKFKRAVLKRQAGVVANMTKFPLVLTSALLDEPAFLTEFESIFDGGITGCIALQDPEQDNIGRSTFSLTCTTGGKQTTLQFQTISGNWQLFAIEDKSEAGITRSGVERSRPNVEQRSPKVGRGAPKAKQSPPKAEGGSTNPGRSSPDAERSPSNGEQEK
jgi:hypothetical protein